MSMHPSTKILIALGVTAVMTYGGYRIWDYRQVKKIRARRIKAQAENDATVTGTDQ